MRTPCRPGSRRPGRGRPGAPGISARRGPQFADARSEYAFPQGLLALHDDRSLAFGDRLPERHIPLQALLLEAGMDHRAALPRGAPENQPLDKSAAIGALLAS